MPAAASCVRRRGEAAAESSIVGGVISLATHRIVAGETEKLPELLPDMVDFALSPYLGAERAAELAAGSRSG